VSGIAGIFSRDGRPVVADSLHKMSAAIAHRGTHASGMIADASMGMVHRMSLTTPESRDDRQPRYRAEPLSLLVADARIDNRAELASRLRLPEPSMATDADLILASYERWGARCAEHLIGDFAFALWDGTTRELFCARDPMGVRPFYYFESDKVFIFASEVRALLALRDVPSDVDPAEIATFIEGTNGERARTHFKAIRRLPAAHTISIQHGRTSSSRYWEPNAEREIRLGSTEEYAEAFRQVFGEAVRARLRSVVPIGAALSGGLDSSSIVCVARDSLAESSGRPLETLSLIFPALTGRDLRLSDERGYIESVRRAGGIEASYIRADELSPVAGIDEMLTHLDEPFAAPNLYLHWAMYRASRARGIGVFLDGFDGDTTVSHGFGRFNGLLNREEWEVFESELRALSDRRQVSTRSMLSHFGLPQLSRLARHRDWSAWSRATRQLTRRFDLPVGRTVVDHGLRPALPAALRAAYRAMRGASREEGVLRHTAVIANGSERHGEDDHDLVATEREMHIQGLSQPSYQRTLEIADQSAAAFGVEPRYPFFDRRLIDFCVAIPDTEKLANGWPRLIFRRAMEGTLPKEIQWRSDKGNLSPNFHRNVRAAVISTEAPAAGTELEQYVDLRAVGEMRRRYCAASSPMMRSEDGHTLYRLMVLERWLAVRAAGTEAPTIHPPPRGEVAA
jgi:asparagine synthase (glutamine-hydrolysing)